ncbi:MAG: hypothetical protein PHE51_10120 [Eubacteriales bacterium]|nr:hypothetical protein [Eubacteriales bacterium]
MTDQDVEDFIKFFDEETREGYCAYPDGQQLDCQDCTLCRKVLYDQMRQELKEIEI